MIVEKNFFDQPVKNYIRTYDNIGKITTGQGNTYTTGCLLEYPYFKENYKSNAVIQVKNKCMMLIQKKCNKLILQESWAKMEIQQCLSLLKKQRRLF